MKHRLTCLVPLKYMSHKVAMMVDALNKTHLSPRKMWWLVVAVAVIWFANLEYRTLIKPDEGRYAEIPREMVVSGDWTTPRLNDLKYFEKPPLQYWATATAYTVFGEHQWTSRLWTGLTGFAGMLLVWFTGMRLFGREAANYAALLLGSSTLYALMGHINTLDMGVTFFITLGIFGFMLGQTQSDAIRRRNWMLLAWAGLALAVLSKGLMGLVLPGAALFIYALVQRDFTIFKRMNWLPGLAVFFLIAAPWFYLVMQANPEFFERFFIYEHYTRFTTKDLGRYQPWYYFIPILLGGALPWTLLMFDAMLRTWRGSVRADNSFNPERFLLVWAVFIYMFFTVSGSKLPSYLLPMFPALALLMGKRIVMMRERTLIWQLLPIVPLMLGLVWIGMNVTIFADEGNALEAELYPQYGVWVIFAGCLLLWGLMAAIFLLYRTRKFAAVVVLALSSLIAMQLLTSGYNVIGRERSAKHLAAEISAEVKPDVTFYSLLMYEQTLPFYLKRTFTLVQFRDEMDFGIKQEPQRYIPTLDEFAARWKQEEEALAIMPAMLYPKVQKLGIEMRIIFQDAQYIVVKKS